MSNPNNYLYVNDNGMIACHQHGGHYLTSALEAHGPTPTIRTPLGTWEQIPAAELSEIGLSCEGC